MTSIYSAPTLAVNIASSSTNGVLHVPDGREEEFFAFHMPSPGRILASRIRECTALRRVLYLKGGVLDPCIVPPMRDHLRSGLPLHLHPDYATLLSSQPEELESQGMSILDIPPEDAVIVESWDIDPSHWYGLMETVGLPLPSKLLVSTDEYGHPLGGPKQRPLAPWLDRLFALHAEGIALPEILSSGCPPEMLRLSSIQRITGFSVLDSAIAFIFGMLVLPWVVGRSRREGIVLLSMDNHCTRAALVYHDRLFALLELPGGTRVKNAGRQSTAALPGNQTERLKPGELMQWLDDLRLGWLPSEKADARGGFLCRAEHFPPEAEGFRPIFVTGPQALSMEGHGQLTGFCPEDDPNCRGLLAAFGQA